MLQMDVHNLIWNHYTPIQVIHDSKRTGDYYLGNQDTEGKRERVVGVGGAGRSVQKDARCTPICRMAKASATMSCALTMRRREFAHSGNGDYDSSKARRCAQQADCDLPAVGRIGLKRSHAWQMNKGGLAQVRSPRRFSLSASCAV
jgi:hypothetical protein